jgi:hypothetical protein
LPHSFDVRQRRVFFVGDALDDQASTITLAPQAEAVTEPSGKASAAATAKRRGVSGVI